MPDNPTFVPTLIGPPVAGGGDTGGGKGVHGSVAVPDTRQLTTGYWEMDYPDRVVDYYTPPTRYPASNVIQPAQTQINISGTGWVLIGLVLLFLLKK